VTGGLRKLNSIMMKIICSFHQMMKWRSRQWLGHATCMGSMRNSYYGLVEKSEQLGQVWRSRYRRKDVTKDLQ